LAKGFFEKDDIKFDYSVMNYSSLFYRNGCFMCYSIDESAIFVDVYSIITVCYTIDLYSKSVRKGLGKEVICCRFTKTN
jgi:hypothetical protein